MGKITRAIMKYLAVKDNPIDVNIPKNARKRMRDSFTVNMVSALISAQMYMNDDFCVVF